METSGFWDGVRVAVAVFGAVAGVLFLITWSNWRARNLHSLHAASGGTATSSRSQSLNQAVSDNRNRDSCCYALAVWFRLVTRRLLLDCVCVCACTQVQFVVHAMHAFVVVFFPITWLICCYIFVFYKLQVTLASST